MGRTNIGGGGDKLNVYAQLAEPSKKDGIWLNTIHRVLQKGSSSLASVKHKFAQPGNAVASTNNNVIYLFGSNSSSYYQLAQKYIISSNTYSDIANLPVSFINHALVAIGTDIYILKDSNCYKYNTQTDTYTTITLPATTGHTVAIGNEIYLFNNSNSCKFDVTTNITTPINNIPMTSYLRAALIGTDIYLITASYIYKYDTIEDTYTRISRLPYEYTSGDFIAVDRYLFLYGNNNVSAQFNYRYMYDTVNNTYTKLTDYPYKTSIARGVAIGTNIYMFGYIDSSSNYYASVQKMNITQERTKYNFNSIKLVPKIDEYIPIADIYTDNVLTVSVNKKIYMFGKLATNSDYNDVKEYNTLTNTAKNLSHLRSTYSGTCGTAVGTDVYLFGGSDSSYYKSAHKYDTLTDTYTRLTDVPYECSNGRAVEVGTDVFLFGSSRGSNIYKIAYKYDTLTDTYTRLTDVPYWVYGGRAVAIGTDIYLFGSGYSSYYKYAYKYDTLTDTYTRLTDIPISRAE